jgi:hypothetical protein
MNQRIRQLAEQAGIYKLNLSDETEYWIMEKFAELLIVKCLTICEELGDKGMDGHYCADEISRTFRR